MSKFESKALEGIFVGYGLESHTYRIYDKISGAVIESCSVTFEEYDGPQGGRVDACDADDEMPQDAIGRMGVGYIRPVEEPLMADREEHAPLKWSPHLHNLNMLHPPKRTLNQAKDKMWTLNMVIKVSTLVKGSLVHSTGCQVVPSQFVKEDPYKLL